MTVISPEEVPSAFGSNIIRLLPNSSTVAVKSVQRIHIDAVGDLIEIFSLLINPSQPVIKRAVPDAMFKASLLLLGSGS